MLAFVFRFGIGLVGLQYVGAGFAALFFTACTKSDSTLTNDAEMTGVVTRAVSETIAVVASATMAHTDSVYLMQRCAPGSHRDSVAQSSLPAAINNYLNTNYTGATFHKAYAIKDTSGAVYGYVVIVYHNDKPVGLQFDTAGSFVKVLEQRERSDLKGSGYHRGGRFQHRDGKGRATVSLTALPASITNYFAANYSGDTLVNAFKTIDSGYVVLSKNNAVFMTVFNVTGVFVKRQTVGAKNKGRLQNIEQSDLPVVITSYLTTTYPAFVFKKAFVAKDGDTVSGYAILIDAKNTSYAMLLMQAAILLKLKQSINWKQQSFSKAHSMGF